MLGKFPPKIMVQIIDVLTAHNQLLYQTEYLFNIRNS